MDNKRYTELDANQVIQRSFDEPTDSLNVNSQLKTVYKSGTTQTATGSNSTFDKIVTAGVIPDAGDMIRFVTGAYIGLERTVKDLNTSGTTFFYLTEALPSSPTGYTYDILKKTTVTADQYGNLLVTTSSISSSGPIKFNLDGSVVEVTEDSIIPSNNLPLPVKITSATGPINITAGDLNVQLSDVGLNPDVTRLGDGTSQMKLRANGAGAGLHEIYVTDSSVAAQLNLTVKNLQYIDCSTTSITTAAYVELITSTTSDTKKIQVLDTTGRWTQIATGASASEIPLLIVGPGSVEIVPAIVPSGTRISVKALDANAITGSFAINLLG